MADCNVFILTQLADGWRVQQFNEGGVWPTTEYDSGDIILHQ